MPTSVMVRVIVTTIAWATAVILPTRWITDLWLRLPGPLGFVVGMAVGAPVIHGHLTWVDRWWDARGTMADEVNPQGQ